ncbi:MAG: hypothetical protein Q4G70_01295 [Pseudomonadota bacterium]|nr:hypothetical protein [Pseudomonadota bacterium]
MRLSILALTTDVPACQTQHSLLGTAAPQSHMHLLEQAGQFSRPATVEPGVMRLPADAYQAPTWPALARNSDQTAQVAGHLAQALAQPLAQTRAILHTQCTLDQQILGSTCLRLQQAYAPGSRLTQTISQNGTAGLATALRLASVWASMASAQHDGGHRTSVNASIAQAPILVSAADKWMAPFYRRIPDVVTYGDAAAACLVREATAGDGADPHDDQAIATVEEIALSEAPCDAEPWQEPPRQLHARLLEWASSQVAHVAQSLPPSQRAHAVLAGDAYSAALLEQVADTSAWGGELLWPSQHGRSNHIHLSSASPLIALSDLVGLAVRRGKPIDAVIWMASLSGHAAALRVRCSHQARRMAHGWASAHLPDPDLPLGSHQTQGADG